MWSQSGGGGGWGWETHFGGLGSGKCGAVRRGRGMRTWDSSDPRGGARGSRSGGSGALRSCCGASGSGCGASRP